MKGRRMSVIRSPREMQLLSNRWLRQGRNIGFVPTMGALHEGHLSLVRRARRETDRVVVSVFVNPLQFDPHEDYLRYPRPFRRDAELCKKNGVAVLFCPGVGGMYERDFQTAVEVRGLSQPLCGRFRPGHFRGVATVVLKLFELVRPHRAYFGEKDFQQLQIVRRMAEDLNIPVRIVGCPVVRERDGLAMSSRNRTLVPGERREAVKIYEALCWGRSLARGRRLAPAGVRREVVKRIRKIPRNKIDYAELIEEESLKPLRHWGAKARIAVAVWVGRTRLIDNLRI